MEFQVGIKIFWKLTLLGKISDGSFALSMSSVLRKKLKCKVTRFLGKIRPFFENNSQTINLNETWCMVIYHSYIPYISANVFVSPTFNYGDIVKISNSKEIAPKSRLFENPYFFNNICQQMVKVILSYKFCGGHLSTLPEIDFWIIFELHPPWTP